MIVKTGANYQAEGGYIEFSADNPNGVTIINGREIPTKLYSTASSITGMMRVGVRKTPESAGLVRVGQYMEYTSLEGSKFINGLYYEVTTTENFIYLPATFGSVISVPNGMKPVLADGSKDVQLIHTETDIYYWIVTGANPTVVMSYTEA